MRETALRILSPALTFVVAAALWQGIVTIFAVPSYIFPDLGQVGSALYRGYVLGEFWPHLWYTLRAMLAGYLMGSIAAILLGALFAEMPLVERFVFPLIVGIQSMPKVALAPLIVVWFGFGIASKVALVAVICFFPIFVNVIAGLRSVDPGLIDMMRSFGASRTTILRQVKFPNAAGGIFAGLQIGIVLGLIGAIAGEFIASTQGLGFLIQNAAAALDLGSVFASLLTLALLGVTGTQLLRLLHRRIAFWDRSAAGADAA